jgi:hypothetical protein
VSAGRPTLVFRTLDSQSGVDPDSLVVEYHGVLVAAAVFDPGSGLAVFPLPAVAPPIKTGKLRTGMLSSDFQEAKNIDTVGPSIMPNTRVAYAQMNVVSGAADDWLLPVSGNCVQRKTSLVVAASAPGGVASVRFAVDGKVRAIVKKSIQDLWATTVSLARGKHTLVATTVGKKGQTASARRTVRVCSG